jgi:hypothetical protein
MSGAGTPAIGGISERQGAFRKSFSGLAAPSSGGVMEMTFRVKIDAADCLWAIAAIIAALSF